MNDEVRLEHAVSRPLAVVRRLATATELSRVVPEACGTVWNALKAGQITGAGRHVAMYVDEAINVEVGVELATPFTALGEVIGSSTPAGRVAAATHFGPYGELNQAHNAIHVWARRHGEVLAGPRWEIYGHWEQGWNQDPGLIRTDVYYLLR